MTDTKRIDAYMALQTQGKDLEHRAAYFMVAHLAFRAVKRICRDNATSLLFLKPLEHIQSETWPPGRSLVSLGGDFRNGPAPARRGKRQPELFLYDDFMLLLSSKGTSIVSSTLNAAPHVKDLNSHEYAQSS